ncbi:hypothetical protein CB1_000968023 [Camelus ferus]|nr:hypothetical protein CB1_000968023 [Camelus ferus]
MPGATQQEKSKRKRGHSASSIGGFGGSGSNVGGNSKSMKGVELATPGAAMAPRTPARRPLGKNTGAASHHTETGARRRHADCGAAQPPAVTRATDAGGLAATLGVSSGRSEKKQEGTSQWERCCVSSMTFPATAATFHSPCIQTRLATFTLTEKKPANVFQRHMSHTDSMKTELPPYILSKSF